MSTDRFWIKIYSRDKGDLVKVREEINQLNDTNISCRVITNNGLSISGPWTSYDKFTEIIDQFPQFSQSFFKNDPSQ